MTSHAFGSSQKVIRTVSHTFPKLGSEAMGSRFREQLTRWTDPAVFTQPDQWKGFLSALVTAHESDLLYMRNFSEEITKNKCNQGRLTLKDLKPDTFESNEKSKLSIRQWSDEFSSWVERIDQDFETMLRFAAQMQMYKQTSAVFSYAMAVMDKLGGWEKENCVGSRFAACMWIYTKAVIWNGQENMQE